MTPEPIRLYDSPVSGNCYKVRLVLALLGLTRDTVKMDIFASETSHLAVARAVST